MSPSLWSIDYGTFRSKRYFKMYLPLSIVRRHMTVDENGEKFHTIRWVKVDKAS